MRAFAKALSLFLGTAVSVVGSTDTMGGAELRDDLNAIAHATLPMHIPPPLAGIRLLEDIFKHMHNLPQLAMSKKPIYQQQSLQNTLAQAPTNPYLAIAPQGERKAAEKAKIAMVQPISKEQAEGSDAKSVIASVKDTRAMNRFAFAPNTYKSENKKLDRDALVPPPPAAEITSKSGYRIAAAAPQATAEPVDEEHAGFKQMSRAARNLYGISNQLSNAQQTADRLASATAAPASTPARLSAMAKKSAKSSTVSASLNRRALPVAADEFQSGPAQEGGYLRGALLHSPANANIAPRSWTISQAPRITEYGAPSSAATIAPAASNGMMQDTSFNVEGAPETPAGGASGAVGGSVRVDQPTKYLITREYDALKSPRAKASANALSDKGLNPVAMNVPNVITGTPTCRLGTNAGEAIQSLAGSYNLKEQKLEGYTVCSGLRHNTTDCAVQLYIKHGMIEAMRIFDPSLMPTDLGISLGDTLPSVKSRFGEPAFMISEPTSGDRLATSGQNYVYPISQVCFQLARNGRSSPKVVSVLIFNMK